ncbi:MAG: AAA family ATPase [Deltaproteobacteria bacterium]|nr:AAA family ATPase [Deltaproteobacteria bacterium]
MYRAYFGLKHKPFSLVPDPRFLFMSPRHKEALAHLLFGMGEGGGFVLLTGEVGTGKTTLCRSMLEQVPPTVDVALVLNPKQTAAELLGTICDELNVAYPPGTAGAKQLTDILNRHLLEVHEKGRATVLVLDEAQNLDIETLEQIRLLTNLETTSEKLLQIILIGQPELKSMMGRPELRQLAQRITARCHLDPLSKDETAAYIRHRLEIAGATRPLFAGGALRLIYKISNGIPRLINVICDRAILGAYAHRRQTINRALVRTAASEVLDKKWKPLFRRPLGWGIAILLLLAIGLSWRLSPWSGLLNLPVFQENREAAVPEPVETPAGAQPSPPPQRDESPERPDSGLNTEVETSAPEEAAPPDGQPSLPPQQGNSSGLQESELNANVEASAPEEAVPPAEPPSVSEPDPEAVNLIDLLKSGTVETSTAAAFETIFRLWDVDFDPKPDKTACDAALAAGLRCHHDRGNWNTLAHYGRPAVLELSDEARRLYLVVATALNDRDVTLGFSGREVTLPPSQVERMWWGDFIILWKPPPLKSLLIRPGSSGPDVRWLKGRLNKAEGLPPGGPEGEEDPVFDDDVTLRVMAFQSAHALKSDGVVGEQTLIQLTAAGNDASGPLLSRIPEAMR